MQIHRVVSGGRAGRAQWWEEQSERVLTETGFKPYVSELFITDRSSELDLVRADHDRFAGGGLVAAGDSSELPARPAPRLPGHASRLLHFRSYRECSQPVGNVKVRGDEAAWRVCAGML